MEYNAIYGVIKIDRDYPNAIAFIRSIGSDDIYPFITSTMFGLGDYTRPHYYENMLLTFGATYKNFGRDLVDWNLFVMKTEHILRNIDFEHAKFHIDSCMGDFIFYWVNKSKTAAHRQADYRQPEYRLTETAEFFFGFGDRPLAVPYPDDRYRPELDEMREMNFKYPVQLSAAACEKVKQFNALLKDHHPGHMVSFETLMGERADDRVLEVLYDLHLKGVYEVKSFKGDLILKSHVQL